MRIKKSHLRRIIREELDIVSKAKAKIAGIKGSEAQSQDEDPLSVKDLEAMVAEDPDNRSMGSGGDRRIAVSRAVSGLGGGTQSYSELAVTLVDGTWHIVVEKTMNESHGGTDRRHLRTLREEGEREARRERREDRRASRRARSDEEYDDEPADEEYDDEPVDEEYDDEPADEEYDDEPADEEYEEDIDEEPVSDVDPGKILDEIDAVFVELDDEGTTDPKAMVGPLSNLMDTQAKKHGDEEIIDMWKGLYDDLEQGGRGEMGGLWSGPELSDEELDALGMVVDAFEQNVVPAAEPDEEPPPNKDKLERQSRARERDTKRKRRDRSDGDSGD